MSAPAAPKPEAYTGGAGAPDGAPDAAPREARTPAPGATQAASRAALQRALETDPTRFAAFQAVRLLGRLRPDRAQVGGWADPGSEIVRFTVPPSLAFPPSEVQTIRPPADGEGPHRLSVTFFGLTGPQAVLPHVYTQHAADRARARDTAFRDFLDLFHHRALSLFYRAWGQSKPVLGHETGHGDWLLDHLLDAAGLGTRGLRGRLPVADEALGYYAALLAPAARSADGLARLVGDYFDVPAEVEQFVGEWRRADGGGQVTLGGDDSASRLGLGVVGDEVWDPQARVRLRLGPLTRAQFDAFLPGGAAHPKLAALARLYVDDEVGVDAQLVLDRGHVAPCVLGIPLGIPLGSSPGSSRDGTHEPASGDRADASRRPTGPPLGRGTWLVSRPAARDPDETAVALC